MAPKLQFFLLLISSATLQISMAGDPDVLSDFILPAALFSPLDGNFFTYSGMRALVNAPFPITFKVTKAAMAEFPAL